MEPPGIGDGEPLLAITLYVPDALLPALSGQGLALRAILDGAPGLEFIVPRWWESAYTVRLGTLNHVGHPQPHALPSLEPC